MFAFRCRQADILATVSWLVSMTPAINYCMTVVIVTRDKIPQVSLLLAINIAVVIVTTSHNLMAGVIESMKIWDNV
jgi:hypothetical protein